MFLFSILSATTRKINQPRAPDCETNNCPALAQTMPRVSRYKLLATWLNTELRSVPTVPMTTTAATAISAAISPYSIAVTPRASVIKYREDNKVRISCLLLVLNGPVAEIGLHLLTNA
jgi:hypothetical protein